MSEVKSALNVLLLSTEPGSSTVQVVMAHNEVSLLLSLYAYQNLHGLRWLLARQTRRGWSRSRMREQVGGHTVAPSPPYHRSPQRGR